MNKYKEEIIKSGPRKLKLIKESGINVGDMKTENQIRSVY